MKNQAEQIKAFILEEVLKHPHDLVGHVMRRFQVSRTTVLRHLQFLLKQDKITKTGSTKQVVYTLTKDLNKDLVINLSDSFDEFEFFNLHFSDLLKQQFNHNAYAIVEYVMTELLNNVKDHAKSKKARVQSHLKQDVFHCSVIDEGEGLFKTIRAYVDFEDIRDILFELSKGKLTSDPVNHSGEGLFFSARAVDRLIISANGYEFTRDNLEEDWTFCEIPIAKGTVVTFEISKNTPRNLGALFEAYTEDFSFTKTDILVDLSLHFGERLISRSQAKRVCRRLEHFKHITLDFKKVEAVGQGFVDQIFRVYQQANTGTTIQYIHANSSVDFMIKRCLAMQA